MAPRTARASHVDEYRELVIRWAPIPGTPQELYFDDDTPDGYIFLTGGWASGKTSSLIAKVLKLSAINAPLPGIWCVPDYNHVQDTIIPALIDPDPEFPDEPWFLRQDQFSYHAHPTATRPAHCLEWEGGGPIWFVSAENAESIAGPNVAWCATDEPASIKEIAWRNTVARVRHPAAKLRQKIAAGTPEGLNFMSDLFGPDRPDNYHVYRIDTRQNTELLKHNPSYIEQVSANATEAELAAYLEGKFVNMSGALAVPMFDPARQYRALTLIRELPLRVAFDFNVDPMTAVIGQQWAGSAGTEYGALEAIALAVSTVDQMCDEIIKRHPSHAAGVVVYGDASGKARNQQSLRSNYQIIKERLSVIGPVTEKVPTANPPVKRRLNSVNRLCKDARGITRFFVAGDPLKPRQSPTRELVRSLQGTIIKPGTNDVWKKPGETLTHLTDAVGYWLDMEEPAQKPDLGAAAIKAPSASKRASNAVQDIRAAKTERLRKELEAMYGKRG